MLKNLTRFVNIISLTGVLQIVFFAALVYGLVMLYFPMAIVLFALSIICALFILSGNSNTVYKLAWITLTLILPMFGGLFYVFYSRRRYEQRLEEFRVNCMNRALSNELANDDDISDSEIDIDAQSLYIAEYLKNTVGFSPAKTNNAVYFPAGEDNIAYMLNAVTQAERYIFLEYFIISKGKVWDSFCDVLKKKAAEGIDVRIICDGMGCMYSLPWKFSKKMSNAGIKVRMFNPVRPFISARVNTRNHRKMAIIDGNIAFCGGINLADEYANIKEMYGHWKDSGVMVSGDIAWNMTLLFLSMWEYLGRQKEQINYKNYIPLKNNSPSDGQSTTAASVVLDAPKDPITVSEHTFINFISRAEKYVYITTPYFMCGGELLSSMYAAAWSGTDIRIITPYIADKKLVKLATESYYRKLIENKIRVFEYLPGFLHAKNIIADGTRAMVGTVNLDYRSLYLHHECGICFFGGDIVKDIDDDFYKTFKQCREITLRELNQISLFKRTVQRICRLFAPFF